MWSVHYVWSIASSKYHKKHKSHIIFSPLKYQRSLKSFQMKCMLWYFHPDLTTQECWHVQGKNGSPKPLSVPAHKSFYKYHCLKILAYGATVFREHWSISSFIKLYLKEKKQIHNKTTNQQNQPRKPHPTPNPHPVLSVPQPEGIKEILGFGFFLTFKLLLRKIMENCRA